MELDPVGMKDEEAHLIHWTNREIVAWVNGRGEWEKDVIFNALAHIALESPEAAKALGAEITKL